MVQYWLDLFTPETWNEIVDDNFKTSGFREGRWRVSQKINPGDILVCYITKISRFSGFLKVISKAYKDLNKAKKIWKSDSFPCLVDVKPLITFDFEHSVPAQEIIPNLSIAAKWGGIVRGSPNRMPLEDGKQIYSLLKKSQREKIKYPLEKKTKKLIVKHPLLKNYKRAMYGEPIDFRGLRNAPINENGVIFLFGLVAESMGFRVSAIKSSFPDCEALRRVPRSDTWERVYIEFEYKSSSFKKHNHPISGCDIIVCWKHDWPSCPLEVIELSKEIKYI